MSQYRILIVEDELPAQAILRRALEKQDDLVIVGTQTSVRGTVEWLKNPENRADILFLDVELSDGMCFDIFAQTEVKSKVVITTAFDNYAVRAFRVNSIDYLLKPIDPTELQAALERCRHALKQEQPNTPTFDLKALKEALVKGGEQTTYKKRFVVRFGDHLTVIETAQIAYFYAEDKSTHLVTTEGRRYILDQSLDQIAEEISPDDFFRISRNCMVSIRSIAGISKHSSSRLKINLVPKPDFEVFVSRSRTNDFMVWLEGK
ncbi:MAG: LytTR family DNA-binding domain-containing protein [Rikenellaceae bacterium]|nr:LytTR family DNA-binding domain-containing protein [Rikenellaceae bacterium]